MTRRAVFYIGGYDPKSPEAFFERLDREADRFAGVWDVELHTGEMTRLDPHTTVESFTASGTLSGREWRCETDFHFVCLDDIVLRDFERPFLKRLARYLVTFADYTASGTGYAFLRHAWRFFIYFMYPFVALLLAVIVSAAMAHLIYSTGVALAWLAAPFVFLMTFSALAQMQMKRRYVFHLMDLWSFSRDFVHRSRSDIDVKLDAVSVRLSDAIESDDYDECLLVGHSTGGALILNLMGRSLARGTRPSDHATVVSVLTVGSTALKVGLHPAAGWFRDQVAAIVAEPGIDWVEYQCRSDLINFYRTQPAQLMGVEDAHKPTVNFIRLRDMLDPATYRRVRGNFFAMHYRFVFGNSNRYHYDFPAICFGPAPLAARGEDAHAFQHTLLPAKVQTP
ncbi:lipase [Rhizobiaceae bacterium]|nr:lipase [Rhizobiaceae bacterium]